MIAAVIAMVVYGARAPRHTHFGQTRYYGYRAGDPLSTVEERAEQLGIELPPRPRGL